MSTEDKLAEAIETIVQSEAPAIEVRLLKAKSQGEHIARHFRYRHLPPKLQVVSAHFAALAAVIFEELPRCAERTVAARKLLEAKDAAVRAALEREEWTGQ